MPLNTRLELLAAIGRKVKAPKLSAVTQSIFYCCCANSVCMSLSFTAKPTVWQIHHAATEQGTTATQLRISVTCARTKNCRMLHAGTIALLPLNLAQSSCWRCVSTTEVMPSAAVLCCAVRAASHSIWTCSTACDAGAGHQDGPA